MADLARDADLLVGEATYGVDQVPEDSRRYLSSADRVGRQAADAGARQLLLCHLWPGTDPDDAMRAAAQRGYPGEIAVASPGLVTEPGAPGRMSR